MANPAPPSRWRRRRRVLAALALLLLALVATFPRILSTPPARRWLLARANRKLAPGGVRCASWRLSWFGPTRLADVALIDPQGDRVIVAPRATWDRNLVGILGDGDHLGTLTIEGATLDVERRADGSIDFIEALRPILVPNPRRDFRLRIVDATLRFRSPGLDRPATAERATLDLILPIALGPATWRLDLANPSRPVPETLALSVQSERRRPGAGRPPPDLTLAVTGRNWPLTARVGEVVASGRFDGKAEATRKAGRWSFSGDARVLGLDATATGLAGDHVRLETVWGTWAVAATAEGWAVDRLDVHCPVASLKAKGRVPAREGAPARIEGSLDLAALAQQLPHALRLREGLTLERGSARFQVDARAEAARTTWDASARIADLVARGRDRTLTLRDPATLSARLIERTGSFEVDHLALKTPFLDASARGDADRGLSLTGTVDLGGLRRQLSDWLDLGRLDLEGRGKLAGDYRRAKSAYTGHLALDLRDVRCDGLAPGSIRREALRLDATIAGPADASGFPRGWNTGRLVLDGGDFAADAQATTRGDALDLVASASAAVRLAGRDGRAEGNFLAHWQGEVLAIDEARVGLRPAEGKAGAIGLAARGRFDRASGELTLAPIPGAAAGAIGLAPAGLRVSGLDRPAAMRAEAALVGDLALLDSAVASWAGGRPIGLVGDGSLRATARQGADGLRIGGKAEARTASPVSVTLQGLVPAGTDRLDVAELVLATRYATLESAGKVDDLGGRRLADLRGTLTPAWDAINAELAARVEPQAVVKGKARAVHLKGPLSGASVDEVLRGLDAEVGVDLLSAEFYGMKVGPASIVARARDGSLAIDPVESTINGGTLRLEPELGRDGSGGLALRLKPGSAIENAEINDEVSRRVLTFVAPILDAATRARGRVSVDIARAEFPIGGDAARRAVVEGHVVFRDAEFAPGPLAEDLLHLIGRDDQPTLKLDQPVLLSIADGKVHQRGLAVPVGRLTRIELDGTVGFDRALDLKAGLPITPAMVGNNPLLGDIARGARIVVPIGGTLSQPKVDREAFHLAMKDLGQDLLRRGVGRGAAELLMRLARPREPDPDAPPPPPRLSPEERRAQRQQRKADRLQRKAERRGDLTP